MGRGLKPYFGDAINRIASAHRHLPNLTKDQVVAVLGRERPDAKRRNEYSEDELPFHDLTKGPNGLRATLAAIGIQQGLCYVKYYAAIHENERRGQRFRDAR